MTDVLAKPDEEIVELIALRPLDTKEMEGLKEAIAMWQQEADSGDTSVARRAEKILAYLVGRANERIAAVGAR